jgi:5-amino-6-(5-phosphoribosylamino)uracil reductase
MADRPYTLLSCSMSLDGYLDGASGQRLILSNDADLDRVDEVRAGCDAILVGAGTVRSDDPRLVVRSRSRVDGRRRLGLSPSPMKVTVSERAKLDPGGRFFAVGDAEKVVYCSSETVDAAREAFGALATVVDGGRPVTMRRLSEDLHSRGVRRLLVEGGGAVLTQFLTDGLADELHLVVAPFFVGDSRAPRFVHDGRYPWHPDHRATLLEARRVDDVVLLRYALSTRCGSD